MSGRRVNRGRSAAKRKSLPYGHQSIDSEDIRAAIRVLRSDYVTQGPEIAEFEKSLAEYCGVEYAVALSSGTSALQAAYLAAGLKPGDEAITSPLTFAATANAVVHQGAKPVFADVDEKTLCIDPAAVQAKITPRTKVVAPVDFGGHPHDADSISEIARRNNLMVVEDAAHSLGARYKGKKVGGLADMTILSFHPVKHITTGEGGMVLTNDRALWERIRTIRHHGILKTQEMAQEQGPWYYDIEEPGHNMRLTDIQAALGVSQLRKLDGFVKRRREIARRYSSLFKDAEEVILPYEAPWAQSSYHLYPVQLRLERLRASRKDVFNDMLAMGIDVQVHYVPVHFFTFYRKQYGYKQGDFPVAERYYGRALTLPLFPAMAQEDVNRVVKSLKSSLARHRS